MEELLQKLTYQSASSLMMYSPLNYLKIMENCNHFDMVEEPSNELKS